MGVLSARRRAPLHYAVLRPATQALIRNCTAAPLAAEGLARRLAGTPWERR